MEAKRDPYADRRSSPRKRVQKTGKVIFNDSQSMIDCTILDISEGGAKLEFPSRQVLPRTFVLQHLANSLQRQSRGGLFFVEVNSALSLRERYGYAVFEHLMNQAGRQPEHQRRLLEERFAGQCRHQPFPVLDRTEHQTEAVALVGLPRLPAEQPDGQPGDQRQRDGQRQGQT